MLAGWINRHQQDVIAYLKEENKILREKLAVFPLSPSERGVIVFGTSKAGEVKKARSTKVYD